METSEDEAEKGAAEPDVNLEQKIQIQAKKNFRRNNVK